MAFNRAVNGDEDVDFDDKTVVLLNDIDLAGLEWTSLDGERIPYITFDGLSTREPTCKAGAG